MHTFWHSFFIFCVLLCRCTMRVFVTSSSHQVISNWGKIPRRDWLSRVSRATSPSLPKKSSTCSRPETKWELNIRLMLMQPHRDHTPCFRYKSGFREGFVLRTRNSGWHPQGNVLINVNHLKEEVISGQKGSCKPYFWYWWNLTVLLLWLRGFYVPSVSLLCSDYLMYCE